LVYSQSGSSSIVWTGVCEKKNRWKLTMKLKSGKF
jgi:hypothetical protein